AFPVRLGNGRLLCNYRRFLRLFIASRTIASLFITIAFIMRFIIGFILSSLGGGLFGQRDLDFVIGAEFGQFVSVFDHLGRVLARLLFGDCAARAGLALFAPALSNVQARAGLVGVDQDSDDSGEQNDFGHG